MTDANTPIPDPLGVPQPGSAANRLGAPPDAAPPTKAVRLVAADLAHRAALEKTRSRLLLTALGFALLFIAVVIKLADATILRPILPHRPLRPIAELFDTPKEATAGPPIHRAMITDRNGVILAVSLPTAALYANPHEMVDEVEAARRLKKAVPRFDADELTRRLASAKQFVYLARQITPREELAINSLGIPGIYFEPTEKRRYPMGRTAAQVLGGVDIDEHGVAGVEHFFDQRLRENARALRLSIDVRVQAVVRDELSQAMAEFHAIGACGIVMDVNTGEVLAMVSLPDYDANEFGNSPPEDRFNRAVTGMYEPGSTFKLQTAAMALDDGVATIANKFDASRPIHIGRYTITDFEGKHRWLYLPEVLAYSSNLGAAHIAQAVGTERQRAWLRNMGMFARIGIELPEAGLPIIAPAQNWREVVTLTVGFGHGIAVSPLHVVRGTAVLANGGNFIRPTILAADPDAAPVESTPIMQASTSDTIRRLMRLVVTDGYGKSAEVPGYYVGGKTGTAEKVAHGGYRKHANIAAFISVFPMQAPRFAVYMMLDEPHANASTHGYATAGWVAAPAAGRVIAQIGPMLGLLPDIEDKDRINQALYVPLEPGRAAGPIALRTPVAKREAKPPSEQHAPAAAMPPQIQRTGRITAREVRETVAAAVPFAFR